MYNIKNYVDNPDIIQTICMLLQYNITLSTGNELTEEIVLQLIDEDYIKNHFRTSIEFELGDKISKLEIEMMADMLFHNFHVDFFKLDSVTELLTEDEVSRLHSSIYSIDEIDVIIHYLIKPSLTEKELKLLRAYYAIVKDDMFWAELEFEALEIMMNYFEEHLNEFWTNDFSICVRAEPIEEVEKRVMSMISDK